ncbi:unnamed protein product [Caretta caretta]
MRWQCYYLIEIPDMYLLDKQRSCFIPMDPKLNSTYIYFILIHFIESLCCFLPSLKVLHIESSTDLLREY